METERRLEVMRRLTPAPGEDPALSYKRLRSLIGFIGLTLPLTCFAAGLADGHLQPSISDYYYTDVTIVFTGTMAVIGVFLLAYRFGTLAIEGLVTTVAGVAALGVAFFHTAPPDATLTQLRLSDVHIACAAVLFVLLGAISTFIFPADVPKDRPVAARWYRALGATIFAALALIVILTQVAAGFVDRHDLLFWLEAVCVLAFSVSFIVKGNARLVDRRYNRDADPAP